MLNGIDGHEVRVGSEAARDLLTSESPLFSEMMRSIGLICFGLSKLVLISRARQGPKALSPKVLRPQLRNVLHFAS